LASGAVKTNSFDLTYNMDSQTPLIFDSQKYLSRRKRAIFNAPNAARNPWFLHEFAVNGIVETLELIKQDFSQAIDIFACNSQLKQQLENFELLGADKKIKNLVEFEPSMVDFSNSKCPSDLIIPQLLPKTYDLICACSGLNFVNDLPGLLVCAQKALRENGCFTASFIGNQSLKELRQAMMQSEIAHFGGAGLRISPMVELESAVKLMTRAGFKEPVSSIESLKVRYNNVFDLFRDLKAMGENAAFANNNNKPLNRKLIAKIADYYQENFSDDDGRIYATFEIITICGWA
jgi:hypothetical protein